MFRIRDVWVHANNIIHTARQIVNHRLRPLGLTSAEGNILLHLLTQPRILRQDEISDQLEISKPAVSRALDSLEQKGLVIRERDSADRRISHVELTARARELGRQIEAIYDEVFAIAAQGVAPADIDTAVSFFALISENFSRAKEQLKGGKGHD